ncbi:hypothetical protein B4096_2500 [Heyndrickxia coagulans]|jgi:hypothetical protein|nr:hypothetical protein B4096_2500 [Heyndrickxia coagulans]
MSRPSGFRNKATSEMFVVFYAERKWKRQVSNLPTNFKKTIAQMLTT